MIILTINKKGSVKLPRDLLKSLGDARHLQLRLNAHGISLTPVRIETASSRRDFPRKGEAAGPRS